MLAAGALLALIAVYGLWLRDSELLRIEHVEVTGVTIGDERRLEAELAARAREMTTLNVSRRDLERAVAGYPAVRAIEATPELPHGVRVHVVEYRPVARLAVRRGPDVPVAADGTLLIGVDVGRKLARLDAKALARAPRTAKPDERRMLRDPRALRSLRAIAAAPAGLVDSIASARVRGSRGMVVSLRGAPDLVLGDLAQLRAKWAAATAVLASGAAGGAAYVDVRLPHRPAAGGLEESGEQTADAGQPAGDQPAGSEEAAGSASPTGAGGAGQPEATGGGP